MRKLSCFFIVLLSLIVSCDGKRPENGILEFTLSVKSVQKNASVEVLSGKTVILSGKTDDAGEIRFGSVRNIGGLKVKVCGGTVDLVSSEEAVAWNGCMEKSVIVTEESEVTAVVDILSPFIEKYRSDTAQSEWFNYLDISGDVFPEFHSSLTDATKRYLWQQAFSKIAETVSVANDTAPETQFSTENLLNMLSEDLTDDNVINGSTYVKFGSAVVNAAFMKGLLADFLIEVSEKFSASELKEWSDKIRNSEARFLGGEDAGKSEISIEISVYPEGNKGAEPEYFSGAMAVEAKAEPENMIVSLTCFADGEKLADKDEIPFSFQGSFSSEHIEDEKEVVIRCEASNGITVKTAEKKITVNNDAPLVNAVFYEHGTLNPTGTEDSPARNSVDVKVDAVHKRYVIEELSCSLEGYQLENQSSANYQYKAVVETEKLPDGKNILKCSASVNKREYKVSFPFYTKNTVSVKVRAYITNPLTGFDNISVSCGGNTSVTPKDTVPSSEDEIRVKLGQVCVVSVSGGSYEPVVSEGSSEPKKFSGALSAVFVPVSDEDVIVTPLTTVGAFIFENRRNSGDISDEELYQLVFEHLSLHLSYAFNWNEEPLNTNAADSRTKYYVLLSGLEYLAYFMETNIGSEHGIYDVSNVLNLMQEDYKDLVFDGNNGVKQLFFGEDDKKTELDANFFRYYYALSIKRFLTSSFNKTIFTQLGTVVSNIASNSDQFLFPAESSPIAVDSSGPVIEISGFYDLFETSDETIADVAGDLGSYTKGDFLQYDLQNTVVPHFAKAFMLKFKVIPENGSFFDLNSVILKSKDQNFVFRVNRIEPQNIENSGFSGESVEFTMLAEYSDDANIPMEKQLEFSVSAQDIAYNLSQKDIVVFLDNKRPAVFLDYPEGTVKTEDVEISWGVSDSRIEKIDFFLSKWDEEETLVFEKESESCDVGCSLSASEFSEALLEAGLTGSIADGVYKMTLLAVDHAGNHSTLYGSFVVDTTPPEIPLVRVESDGKVLLNNSVIKTNYFTASLVEPDEDVSKWALKISCSIAGESFVQDKTGGYVAAHEMLDFFNLLTASDNYKLVECKGFISVCDEVGNCTNKDFSESAGSIFIDNQPPRFVSYDTDNSIFTECIVYDSSIIVRQCLDYPNCNSGGSIVVGTKKPQILFSYADNFSTPENMTLFIQSSEAGWVKSCSYVPNVNTNGFDGNCNKFYCNLEGSVNGINNFKIIAYDEVGNSSEHPLTIAMDFTAVEPLKINLTDDFFTSNGKSNLWWETKSGVDYKCTITKHGNTIFSASCSNYSDILPSMLAGTGYYTVSVESKSALTQRTDVAEFKFFDLSDFNLSVEPQKGQFLYSGGIFKVKVTADSGNMAEISKIELYLYGRYLGGVLQDSIENLVVSRGYQIPVSSFNNIFSSAFSTGNIGQFRNMRVNVTFKDNSHYIKSFTRSSSDAFLYCLLSSDESPDNASVTFKNKALNISFDKPSCVAANDYTLSLKVETPSECEGNSTLASSVSVVKNYQNNFSVTGDFVFFKDENHEHSFDCGSFNFCSEVQHSCAVKTHNFASDTNLKIIYGSGKTFTISPDANVQSSNSETEIVFYDESGDYDEYDNRNCKKCANKLSTFSSCFGGKYKTINLR